MSTTGMSPAAAVIPAPAADELDWQKGGGLLPVIVQHAVTGAVLMLGYMNREAYAATLATAQATFYSRSRRQLWRKGESSGHVQRVVEMRVDCDQDAVVIKVEQAGPGQRRHRSRVKSSRTGNISRRPTIISQASNHFPSPGMAA